jgi:hypothetical protein
LVAALLRQPADREVKEEAAEALDGLMRLAVQDLEVIRAGVRRAAILRELGDPSGALTTLQRVQKHTGASPAHEILLLPERIRVLLDLGEHVRAASDLTKLHKLNPDHQETNGLRRLLAEGA